MVVFLPRFEKLEVHALLCINNLVSSLELEVLGGLDNLHTVWQGLVQLTATKHGEYMAFSARFWILSWKMDVGRVLFSISCMNFLSYS